MEFNADIFGFCYATCIIFAIMFFLASLIFIIWFFLHDDNNKQKTNKQRIEDLEKQNKKLKCDITNLFINFDSKISKLKKENHYLKKQLKNINSTLKGVDKK